MMERRDRWTKERKDGGVERLRIRGWRGEWGEVLEKWRGWKGKGLNGGELEGWNGA